jgi:hypothetical protein
MKTPLLPLLFCMLLATISLAQKVSEHNFLLIESEKQLFEKLRVTNKNHSNYFALEQESSLNYELTNISNEAFLNITIKYSVDSEHTENIIGEKAELMPEESIHLSIPAPKSAGKQNVTIWVEFESEDSGTKERLSVLSDEVLMYSQINERPRTPLLEVFSASSCAPCRPANAALKQTLSNSNKNYTMVKYQLNFPNPGDPYYITEANTRRSYYGVSGIPVMHADGGNGLNPGSLSIPGLGVLQNKPAFLEMSAIYTIEGQKVSGSVNILPTENVGGSFVRLFMAIIENKTFKNVGNNGETEFENVLKRLLPTASGIVLGNFTPGEMISREFEWEFAGEYRLPPDASQPINHSIEHSVEDFNNLSVIFWVQNMQTREVLQSVWATNTSSTDEIEAGQGIISLYPNPSTDHAFIHFNVTKAHNCSIEIFNQTGQLVRQRSLGVVDFGNYTEALPIEDLSNGIYFVRLNLDHQFAVKKLLIQK